MSNPTVKPNKRIPRPPIGWPLLPIPENGILRYPSLEESIRQQIKVILLVRPGELLMRPQFGAGLSEFLHQPNTLETRQQIQDTVIEALGIWERRILVDRVEVWEEDDPDTIRIEIAYRIKQTGEQITTTLRMNVGS